MKTTLGTLVIDYNHLAMILTSYGKETESLPDRQFIHINKIESDDDDKNISIHMTIYEMELN